CRRQERADAAAKSDEAGLVACPCTCGHKRECGVDRGVKLGLGTYAAGHQTPGVDGHYHGLIALDLILAGGQLRTAGGGGPGDVPELIAANVIAHGFELAALTAADSLALNGDERLGSQGFEFHLAGTAHIRIDLNALDIAEAGLAPDQAVTGKVSDGGFAEFVAAPVRRL